MDFTILERSLKWMWMNIALKWHLNCPDLMAIINSLTFFVLKHILLFHPCKGRGGNENLFVIYTFQEFLWRIPCFWNFSSNFFLVWEVCEWPIDSGKCYFIWFRYWGINHDFVKMLKARCKMFQAFAGLIYSLILYHMNLVYVFNVYFMNEWAKLTL